MADEIAAPAEAPVETPVVETVEAPEPQTLDGDIERAFETTFGDRERDEFGRFKAKDNTPPDPQPSAEKPIEPVTEVEAPEWLNDKAARAEWAKVPPAVRDAADRRLGEMARGIEQYRETLAPYQPFLDMARQSGVDPVALVGRYVEIDRAFTQNPLAGFEMIARSFGTDFRTIAAHVLGKEAPPRDAQVSQLQQELAATQREVQELRGLKQRYQTERQSSVEKTVSEFSAQHPRFEELAPAIQGILKAGLAADLPTAYAYAERLNPAPVAPLAPAAATPDASARTGAANPKTTLGITGAPSSGSNPASRPKIMSLDDAISSALSAAR